MWRHGNYLRPYIFDAVKYCREHHNLREAKSIHSFSSGSMDESTSSSSSCGGLENARYVSMNTRNELDTTTISGPGGGGGNCLTNASRDREPHDDDVGDHNGQVCGLAARRRMVAASQLRFLHVPIVDCSCTSDATIIQLCYNLCWRLIRGEVVYVHCWGGHGRTGTVVAVVLGLLYGISTREALERTQMYHDIRRVPLKVRLR
jgi:hypothetical protein